jgi:hypothetical protein
VILAVIGLKSLLGPRGVMGYSADLLVIFAKHGCRHAERDPKVVTILR